VFTATVEATNTDTGETSSLTQDEFTKRFWVGCYVGVYEAGLFDVRVSAEGFRTVTIEHLLIPEGRLGCRDYVPVDLLVELDSDD